MCFKLTVILCARYPQRPRSDLYIEFMHMTLLMLAVAKFHEYSSQQLRIITLIETRNLSHGCVTHYENSMVLDLHNVQYHM